MITLNYRDELESAFAEFATLSSYAQQMLNKQKSILDHINLKLDELSQSGAQPMPERAPDSYSEGFVDDFENGLYKWSNCNTSVVLPEIVVDSQTNSHALKLTGVAVVTPNSFSYPTKAFVSELSYKMRYEGQVSNVWYGIRLFVYYVDANNYCFIDLYRNSETDTKLTYRVNYYFDGVQSLNIPKLQALSCNYDNTWLDVNITYTELGKAVISISDGVNTDLINCDSKVNGRPVLGGGGLKDEHRRAVFYDDVQISLKKGTWDEDIDVDKVHVYYKGNTGVQGDDVVTLQGEKLGDTLAKAYVVKVDDTNSSIAGYVRQANFSSTGTESIYIHPTQAVDVWNALTQNNEAQRVSLLRLC